MRLGCLHLNCELGWPDALANSKQQVAGEQQELLTKVWTIRGRPARLLMEMGDLNLLLMGLNNVIIVILVHDSLLNHYISTLMRQQLVRRSSMLDIYLT
jgi:hypothetical protein